MKLTAVLPLIKKDVNRAKILLHSLECFFPDILQSLIIISPDDLAPFLGADVPWKYLREDDLIPPQSRKLFYSCKGWMRQQMVKLLAVEKITTPYYLCFDADVICRKHTLIEDLFENDMPHMNKEPKKYHTKWWEWSYQLMGMDKKLDNNGLGVTPAIFISDEVKSLLIDIEKRFKKPLLDVLCTNPWTEYTLYWTWLEKMNRTEQYSVSGKIYGESLWRNGSLKKEYIKKIFTQEQDEPFFICQGNAVSDKMAYRYSKILFGEWDIGISESYLKHLTPVLSFEWYKKKLIAIGSKFLFD